MAFLNTTFDSLRTAVNAAWTDVAANGVYRAREIVRLTSTQKASALPFACIDWNPRAGDEWGIENVVDDGICIISYVHSDSILPDALTTKLETLREYLLDNALTRGQVIGQAWCSDSAFELQMNRYFIYSNRPFFSGAVLLRLISGETSA